MERGSKVGITKQEVLDYFKDINAMYNNPNMLDSLSNMIDELLKAKDINVPTKWISVKDKLPENNAVCLTYSPKGKMRVAEAFLPSLLPNSKCDPMECWWSTHGSGGARFVAVTHWMPLPEPPKEGDGK